MYRVRVFLVMALLCSAVLWSTSIVQAQTPPTPSTWGSIKALYNNDKDSQNAPMLIPGSHDWSNNVKSEAFYTLDGSRNGYSNLYYQNCAMGDWNYPINDGYALTRVTSIIGQDNVGPLGFWSGIYQQGGWCKFFADLILYRSSYGYGEGYHLSLPAGYTYATRSYNDANVGWVLQSPPSNNHTAIVVAKLSSGLDVVDSNWIGTYYDSKLKKTIYSYAIARHVLTWSTLSSYGFKAYCPWIDGTTKNGGLVYP